MIYYELIELTDKLIKEKPLTPLRVCKIRESVEKAWVELNAEYSRGGGYFSDEMFNYYLHGCFEAEFNASIN